jgi:hypothetical protein
MDGTIVFVVKYLFGMTAVFWGSSAKTRPANILDTPRARRAARGRTLQTTKLQEES